MATQGRRHFSSPNIVLTNNMKASARGTPQGPTITEEEEDSIVISRSDGAHHDIVSVFANPGIANVITSQRTRAMSESSSGKDLKDDHDHDQGPTTINIARSDGLSHDIVKVFRANGESTRSSKNAALGQGDMFVSPSLQSLRSTSVDASCKAPSSSSTTNTNTGEKIKAGRSSTFAKIADLLTGRSREKGEKEDVIPVPRRSFNSGNPNAVNASSVNTMNNVRQQNEFFMKTVRIVHMSDTHSLLRATNRSRFLPAGNILVHTGNFTCFGREEEFAQFNSWLESVSDTYHYRIVILGHKDVKVFGSNFDAMKKLLTSATHVLCHEEVTVLGIRFYGVPWNFQHRKNYSIRFGAPSSTSGRFDDITENPHVLLTHGPAYGRLDSHFAGEQKEHWGSRELAEAIRRARPQVHMHGHVKDCKGVIPALGNYPLVVNGCVTNVNENIIWAAPTVIKATQVNLDSTTNTVSWAFALDSLDD